MLKVKKKLDAIVWKLYTKYKIYTRVYMGRKVHLAENTAG